MINFPMDHAFIVIYCLVRICSQLWDHRVIETLFLPFMGQCLPNWGVAEKKIFLIHTVILQPSSFTPWYPSKGFETFYPHKYMHVTCSPPGSSEHGILQGRILQWAAMPSPEDPPDPGITPILGLLHWQVGSLPLVPLGSP